MFQKLYHSFFILLSICLLSYSLAQAQETIPITTRELTKRAQKIIIGEVIAQHSAWDDLGREIYTYIKLRVDRVIKSDRPDSIIVLRHLGGRVGNIESHVAGLPQFRKEEHVLVFLGPYKSTNYYGLIDWYQGKYVIKKGKTSEKVLHGTGPGHGQSVEKFINELRRYL
ncbi:MAG: hypothetical protein ACE5NG_10750 [bacterium]